MTTRSLLASAIVIALAGGCSVSPPSSETADALPTETFTGTMSVDAVRSLPAVLYTSPGQVELVVGSTRVTADDITFDGGRLRFRAPQFPVSRTTRRTLRCDLSGWPAEVLAGTCQAGAERFRVILSTDPLAL